MDERAASFGGDFEEAETVNRRSARFDRTRTVAGGATTKDELFEELLQSVREAGAIARGEAKPSRATKLSVFDVKQVRESLGFSQHEFARALRVSVGTIRNGEQNRRQPTGPARVLLTIVAQRPDVLKLITSA